MGVGKTVKIVQQLQEWIEEAAATKAAAPQPSTAGSLRCLLLTFSRTLIRKYAQSLKSLGFVNYLDVKEYYLNQDRIVVCLDSLPRLASPGFDVVIVDEALSVLLHMGSPFMASKINEVTWHLQLVLIQANRLFLLDAAVDHTIVHDVVQFLQMTL
ncbi:hypothetical protein V8C86DRAFT_3215300 [Haematococcus lacustris]